MKNTINLGNDLWLGEPDNAEEFAAYFDLRFRILRKPWGEVRGSEKDNEEDIALHLMIAKDSSVLAVGRLQKHDDAAQVRYFAVDDACQGLGFGRQLMSALEDRTLQLGLGRVYLHARENAVPFYKATGYRIIEKSYLLFGSIQHYLMEKILKNGADSAFAPELASNAGKTNCS